MRFLKLFVKPIFVVMTPFFLEMIYQLVVSKVCIINLSALKSKLKVKEWTWRVSIMQPTSLLECPLKIRIPTSDNKHFIAFLKSILLFPFAIICTMWEWSEFFLFLFHLNLFFLFLFWTRLIIIIVIFLISLLLFRLGLFLLFLLIFVHNLIIVQSFQNVLFYCVDDEFFKVVF